MRTLALLLLLSACGEVEAPVIDYTPSIEAPADVAEPPADATKTESGLAYKVLKASETPSEEKPTNRAQVEVHYTGWTTDGARFDSSRERNEPARFGLNGVIAGWTEGLQLMSPGDHFRFWIPQELAYKGQPGKPAGMLVFDVELLSFKNPPKPVPPPDAPADVAAPPADAQKTASGLAYKVITQGQGGPKPTAASMVGVHYAGWTTDGKNFDFSRKRGTAANFPLGQVIAGWTEGLQLMSAGDTYRFWIPEELAYKGQPGKPAGMLVFDVELLAIANPPAGEMPAQVNTTESGLKWVLTSDPVAGARKPGPTDTTKVNWTGWTQTGEGVLSNVGQDPIDPTPYTRQLAALGEAIALLGVGERGRFWIPEELVAKGNPRAPKGALVFDIELVSID